MSEKESFDEYRLLILDNFRKLFKEVEKLDERVSTIEKEMVAQKIKVGFIGTIAGIVTSIIVAVIIKYIGG